MLKNIVIVTVIGFLGLGSVGCATHTGNGALIGGTGGAILGAGVGSLSHRRAGEGALLGGAIGAIGGAIIGNEADKQERYGSYDRYDRGYDRPARYYERDYGYEPRYSRPRYYRTYRYEEPRTYYETRVYRTYGRAPRGRYYESYYECD